MLNEKKKKHLFVLKEGKNGSEVRNAAIAMNLPVPIRYENEAMLVMATEEEADQLFATGHFEWRTFNAVKAEHTGKMKASLQLIAGIWNKRFQKQIAEPAPKEKKGIKKTHLKTPSAFLTEKLRGMIPEKMKNISENKSGIDHLLNSKESRRALLHELYKRFGESSKVTQLAEGIHALSPAERLAFFADEFSLCKETLSSTSSEPLYPALSGEIAYGAVFVDSNETASQFSDDDREKWLSHLEDGVSWITENHPSGNLTWVVNVQKTRLSQSVSSTTTEDDLNKIVYPATGKISYNGKTYTADYNGLTAYKNELKTVNASSFAFVFYLTKFDASYYAYARPVSYNYIMLSQIDSWDWYYWFVPGYEDQVAAHETLHIFGAMDEYSNHDPEDNSGSTDCYSCTETGGNASIPNGNCQYCCKPDSACVMVYNWYDMCEFTRGHIGWFDLFAGVNTANESNAGTDDKVWLDIGTKSFELNSDQNDREQGNFDGHAIWAGGSLKKEDIKRILIRKDKDGTYGGWKLQRLRIYTRDGLLLDKSPNKWLENNDLMYLAASYDSTMVHKLVVYVTTGDVSYAGTDDKVTMSMGGFSWTLDNDGENDFERNTTNKFNLYPQLNFYKKNITGVKITKASDGLYGGWYLKGVKIVINDVEVYNNQSINKWLEDDHLSWSASFTVA